MIEVLSNARTNFQYEPTYRFFIFDKKFNYLTLGQASGFMFINTSSSTSILSFPPITFEVKNYF